MPELYLNVTVKEMSDSVERDLGKTAAVKGKIDRLSMYFLTAKVRVGTYDQITRSYEKIMNELRSKSYVKKVEISSEVELLSA
jgi:uncharacterized protein YlbG (UPF0298 family)